MSVGDVSVSTFGGYTTCFELDLPEHRIILDAGSGLVGASRERDMSDKPTLLLISHLHWDHIVGFPFFPALFRKELTLDIWGVKREDTNVLDAILELNKPPIFPIDLRTAMSARIRTRDLEVQGSATFGPARIEWTEVCHPGGCSAFAITVDGQRLVFTGDVELPRSDLDALAAFVGKADVLVVDSQYTPAEYPEHAGWGHSTNVDAATFAARCGVQRLYLTHHDPIHSDDVIFEMEREAREIFPATEAARFGMTLARGPEHP